MFTEEVAKQRAAQVLEQIREDWETTGTGHVKRVSEAKELSE